MDNVLEYAYMWNQEKDRYVLVKDELGESIFEMTEKEIMYCLIEDEKVQREVVKIMEREGNETFYSMDELKEYVEKKRNIIV